MHLKNRILPLLITICLLLIFLLLFGITQVFAEEPDIEQAKAQLEQSKREYDQEIEDINNLKSLVATKNEQAVAAQDNKLKSQQSFNQIAVQQYKCDISSSYFTLVFSSTNLSDFFRNIEYANLLMKNNIRVQNEQDRAIQEFNNSIKDLNNQIDLLNEKVIDANNKLNAYQTKLDEVSKKAEVPKEEIAQAANIEPPSSPVQWLRGSASAYGGESDPGAGSRTSTGASITESSMGISIPISTPNLSSYYGRSVQIKLNGKIVIGTINDCGGLNGGSRCMDVQPGIFHSFGFSSCQAWGVQNVEYIIM